jgi:NAD(P)-dependent dehydrogenase (short-subunit alcohol dehydrogenase family)
MDTDELSLDGKVAIVTGGARGLGRAFCEKLCAHGAIAVIADRKVDAARELEATVLAQGGRAVAMGCDVRDAGQVGSMVASAVKDLGRIDILVNNAGGIYLGHGRPVDTRFIESDESDWDGSYQLNLRSALLCTREAARAMVSRGVGGSIINIASSEALRAAPGFAAYAAFKAGLVNFTRTLALELSGESIRVNCVAPDALPTESLLAGFPGLAEAYARHVPLGRAGRAEEAAAAVLFFASDLSSFVTGVTLPVEGGMLAAGGWLRHPTKGWTLDPAAFADG